MYEVHCSSLGRIEACPGSLIAGDGIETPNSDASLSGTIIHGALHAWARGQEVNEDALEAREAMIFRWFKSEVEKLEAAHGGMMIRLPELKMEFNHPSGDYALVGRGDLIIIPGDGTIHLIDYKTGFAEQSPAPKNRQLMGYVFLLNRQKPEWYHIFAHLFSAGDPAESRFTAAEYTSEAIEAAGQYLDQVIRKGIGEDAPRISGGHCQYCAALGTANCPETSTAIIEAAAEAITKTPSDCLPVPARCAEIYDAIKAVDRYAAAFLPALKEAVEKDPDGWADAFSLKPGAKRRSFKDVEAACQRLIDQEGIQPSDIWKVISLSPAKAEGLVKAAKKEQMKAKEVKEYFASSFDDLIGNNTASPSLVRVV